MNIVNEIFVDSLNKNASKEKADTILEKINKRKISWWDISEMEKLGIEIPEELEIIADENIAYDKDNLPITDEDIKLAKIKLVENTAKIDMINYLWLNEILPEKMDINEKVNTILELYKEIYLTTKKISNIKVSTTKSKTTV